MLHTKLHRSQWFADVSSPGCLEPLPLSLRLAGPGAPPTASAPGLHAPGCRESESCCPKLSVLANSQNKTKAGLQLEVTLPVRLAGAAAFLRTALAAGAAGAWAGCGPLASSSRLRLSPMAAASSAVPSASQPPAIVRIHRSNVLSGLQAGQQLLSWPCTTMEEYRDS